MVRLIFFLLAAVSCHAATLTAGSGKTYATLALAWEAANPGDVIELTPGEVYSESLTAGYKANPLGKFITIRGSKSREVLTYPRASPAIAHLMPIIRVNTPSEPAITFGRVHAKIASVNTSTDRVTLESGWGVTPVEGEPISCRPLLGPGQTEVTPAGLTENTVFIMTSVSGLTFIPKTKTGGNVDITDSGTGDSYCTPVLVGGYVRFIGIKFDQPTGVPTLYDYVRVGQGMESSLEGMPHHVEFYNCYFTSPVNEEGPRNHLALRGRYLKAIGNYFENAKQFSSESHAIVLDHTYGPVELDNNYINGASINILAGGSGVSYRDLVTTDLSITNNLLEKSPYMLYMEGAGAPSGSCLTGRFYRNTTPSPNTCPNGACYTCQASAWVLDTGATYRNDDYLLKGLMEFKTCLRCRVEGNILRTSFQAEDTGNSGFCFLASAYSSYTIRDVIFRRNKCQQVWSGFNMGTYGPNPSDRNGPITIEHNEVLDFAGPWPDYSKWPTVGDGGTARSFIVMAGWQSVHLNNNTVRSATSGSPYIGFQFAELGTGNRIYDIKFENNIVPQGTYPFNVQATGDDTCTSSGKIWPYVISPANAFKNNVMVGASTTVDSSCAWENLTMPTSVTFTSSSNSRLPSNSPFAAGCPSGCSYPGTDGANLGPDMDDVDQATSGALLGNKPWLSSLRIDVGSTLALLSYDAPTSADCTWTLYGHARRLSGDAHADTTSSGAADSRTGSVAYTAGRAFRRQFPIGTGIPVTADTNYTLKGSCDSGNQVVIKKFKTKASATAKSFSNSGPAATGQICSDAAMTTSCTSFGSAVTHSAIVSGLKYYKRAGNYPVIAILGQ